MKTAERSLLIITLIGFGMKAMHTPTAAIVLTLSSVLLAAVYLGMNKFIFPDISNSKSKTSFLTAGSALGVSVIALLLKVQHWPFATAMALLGLVLCISTVIMITSKIGENAEERSLLFRIVPALLLVALVGVMPFV